MFGWLSPTHLQPLSLRPPLWRSQKPPDPPALPPLGPLSLSLPPGLSLASAPPAPRKPGPVAELPHARPQAAMVYPVAKGKALGPSDPQFLHLGNGNSISYGLGCWKDEDDMLCQGPCMVPAWHREQGLGPHAFLPLDPDLIKVRNSAAIFAPTPFPLPGSLSPPGQSDLDSDLFSTPSSIN